MSDGRDERGQFTSENEARLVHGNARALKDLQHGRPLRGLAGDIAAALGRRLVVAGPGDLALEAATNRRAVALLFLQLILSEIDPADLDRWCQRFSWLNSGAFRQFRDIAKLGLGNRAALLEEMRQAVVDQATVSALLYGLTIGDADFVTMNGWARTFGHANTKAGVMLRDLAELEKEGEDGEDVVDYEAILAEKAKEHGRSAD